MDHATLSTLRDRHPAWRLLASPHAPLVASFLHRVFVAPNVRVMSEADLAEALEDELFALREQVGPEAYPKGALDYLNDWAAPDKGWLRKFYKPGTDEAQFDLTPATEKAIAWLLSLTERPFVGTESRLLTLFALLEQISAGTEADPIKRVADLRKKRDELDAEIARVLAGDVPLLDDTAVNRPPPRARAATRTCMWMPACRPSCALRGSRQRATDRAQMAHHTGPWLRRVGRRLDQAIGGVLSAIGAVHCRRTREQWPGGTVVDSPEPAPRRP